LGIITEEQGQFEQAEKWYEKSLEIKEKQGNEHGAAQTYHQLGKLKFSKGDLELSVKLTLKGFSIFIKKNDNYSASIAFNQFIEIYQSAQSDSQTRIKQIWEESGLGPFEQVENRIKELQKGDKNE